MTLPKVCGGDVELGNFIAGLERTDGSGAQASRALLRAMIRETGGIRAEPRLSRVRAVGGSGRRWRANPQDTGRVFLPTNGGSVYIDLDHLELCLPEVTSAFDHVAAWHALLRVAQAALAHANQGRAADRQIQVLVNNSDGWGNSYGGHLNIMLGRLAWEGLMRRRLHHLAYLASYQASALLFTGQGKVGSENDRPATSYQVSQRADFIETLLGPQTTFFRPLVNTRDEPHSEHARLHLISFDTTLAETASLLRVGVTQLILALIEAGQVNPALALDDPVAALQLWSHDPSLEARAPLAGGGEVTAVELQQRFLDEAVLGLRRGDFDGTVPRAGEIISIWQQTLDQLARRDWPALARRLDWVAKLAIIERAREQHGLDWSAPEAKMLDHLYSSLNPDEGLFWSWAEAGLMNQVVDPARIRHFMDQPPEDTRAFVRAHLLREAGADGIEEVDWDRIRFRLKGERVSRMFVMPNPLAGAGDPAGLEQDPAAPNHGSSQQRRTAP